MVVDEMIGQVYYYPLSAGWVVFVAWEKFVKSAKSLMKLMKLMTGYYWDLLVIYYWGGMDPQRKPVLWRY